MGFHYIEQKIGVVIKKKAPTLTYSTYATIYVIKVFQKTTNLKYLLKYFNCDIFQAFTIFFHIVSEITWLLGCKPIKIQLCHKRLKLKKKADSAFSEISQHICFFFVFFVRVNKKEF